MNIDLPLYVLAPLCWALMVAGILWHGSLKLAELERAGSSVDWRTYWLSHKWETVNVLLGAHLLLAMTWAMGEMSLVGSICIGMTSNSAGDKLRARAGLYVDKALEKSGDKPAGG